MIVDTTKNCFLFQYFNNCFRERKIMQRKLKGVFFQITLICAVACFSGCHSSGSESKGKLFDLVPSSISGIDFSNDVKYTEELNAYTFRNFYNGGGVGIGDINNDGLPDVFFCGNLKSNKL
jgi:hypothetical protein